MGDEQLTDDERFMERALELAKKGCGFTSPNPMVGAVIVKNGHVIAEGYHHRLGDLHAERDALSRCEEDPAGATIYVTLEPCCHQGRQPPCTDALVEAGLARVVVGSGDPNPLVAGRGLQICRDAGMEVTEHVLEDECLALNEIFFHYIASGRPFVLMKYAMTLDGKIACWTGDSKWVTGAQARENVHRTRHAYKAIMVGIGTVLADDPLLTCRIEGGVDPIRVVCDSRLRISLDAQIARTAHEVPTIVATAGDPGGDRSRYASKRAALEQAGCEIVEAPGADGKVDLDALMTELGRREIDSVLLEGGSALDWAMLEAGHVDKVQAYVAPKLFGGAQAKSPIGGTGFAHPPEAVKLRHLRVERFGEDLLVEGEVEK